MLTHLFGELLGVTILSTVVSITIDANWNAGHDSFYSPWAVSVGLLSAMVITAMISGAHFNPSVTTAFIIRALVEKQMTNQLLIKYLLYIPIQLVGAWLGALISYAMTNQTNYISIANDTSYGAAFLAEIFFTFALASTALIGPYPNTNKIVFGMCNAGTLFMGASTAGRLSGACFNPAIGIGLNTLALISYPNACDHIWVYIFAPLLGGALSSVLYFILKKDLESMKRAKALDEI